MTARRTQRRAWLPAVLALTACGGDAEPRLDAGPFERSAALRAGALAVGVRDAGDERLGVTARRPDGAAVAIAQARATARASDEDAVRVPLSAEGRARLADCGVTRLDVELTGAGATPLGAASAPVTDAGPPCGRFFGPEAPWNSPLPADAPLDPASRSLVTELRRQVEANYAANFGPEINAGDYSTRVYTAGPDVPRVRVALPPAKAFAEAPFRGVPLPADARPSPGTDNHLVLWQPSTDTMWEFYGLKRRAGTWRADWGGRIDDVSRSDGLFRPTPEGIKYGATASGLALAGGLITPGDLRSGRIDHALAFAIPEARAGVWTAPAQRTDGVRSTSAAIPEGARFRIDPRLDLGALDLPPLTRMMAEAVQRYGMILRDQSGVVSFYAQTPVQGPNTALDRLKQGKLGSQVLRSFPWDRLQLVEMELSP